MNKYVVLEERRLLVMRWNRIRPDYYLLSVSQPILFYYNNKIEGKEVEKKKAEKKSNENTTSQQRTTKKTTHNHNSFHHSHH